MKLTKYTLVSVLALLMAAFAIQGCTPPAGEEGAEDAQSKTQGMIDETADAAGEAADDAAGAVGDAADDAAGAVGDAAEDAAGAVGDAADDAAGAMDDAAGTTDEAAGEGH